MKHHNYFKFFYVCLNFLRRPWFWWDFLSFDDHLYSFLSVPVSNPEFFLRKCKKVLPESPSKAGKNKSTRLENAERRIEIALKFSGLESIFFNLNWLKSLMAFPKPWLSKHELNFDKWDVKSKDLGKIRVLSSFPQRNSTER